MFPSTSSLLGIPLELRLDIFEYVLATASHDHNLFYRAGSPILGTGPPNEDDYLTYRDGMLVPLPALLGICQELRAELLPLVFQRKTVWFYTFGDLGVALHSTLSTVPYWKRVHIEWTGRRFSTAKGARWQLEPRLEMLKRIPNLSHLSLDTDLIRYRPDDDLETEIALITNQICCAIPQHSSLRTVEITGCVDGNPVVRNYCKSFVTGRFKRMFER